MKRMRITVTAAVTDALCKVLTRKLTNGGAVDALSLLDNGAPGHESFYLVEVAAPTKESTTDLTVSNTKALTVEEYEEKLSEWYKRAEASVRDSAPVYDESGVSTGAKVVS